MAGCDATLIIFMLLLYTENINWVQKGLNKSCQCQEGPAGNPNICVTLVTVLLNVVQNIFITSKDFRLNHTGKHVQR